MNPWLESLGVALLALVGVVLGRWFSRLHRPYWLLGYLIPLFLIILYGIARHWPQVALVPPVSWMMMGRNKFAAIGVISTLVLTTPLSRLPQRRDRYVVALLMVVVVLLMSIWPFLCPAFIRGYLSTLQTNIDANGVCLQRNDFDCGPASAVTALRRLGLPAEEGEIAILAHTGSTTGTEPDVLAEALRERYGKDGLVAEYRVFKNLDELERAGLTLAVIKFNLLLDHFVTVLEVSDNRIVVGDPAAGLTILRPREFLTRWRFTGVVLSRPGADQKTSGIRVPSGSD